LILNLGLLLFGLLLLFFGGEALVRGSVSLAERFGISKFVVGLVIVGFGTSTPELLVSVQASLAGSPDIAIGNIVGSNIAHGLLLVALAALIADDDARHQRRDQIVQPLGLGPFLKGDVNRAAHAAEELDKRRSFRRHDRARDDASPFLADRGHRACLMDVEPDILGRPLHECHSLR